MPDMAAGSGVWRLATPSIGQLTGINNTAPTRTVGDNECFTSWENYHSASELAKFGSSSLLSTSVVTELYTIASISAFLETYVDRIDTTKIIFDGEFPVQTTTIDTTSTTVVSFPGAPPSTETEVFTNHIYTTFYPTNTLSRPNCTLPPYLPQCESQWDSWITTQLTPAPSIPPDCDLSAGDSNTRPTPECAKSYSSAYSTYANKVTANPPSCSQASIGSSLCGSVRDAYVHGLGGQFFPKDVPDRFFSAGYLGNYKDILNGDLNITWSWPTSATLANAPSCTLGCGRCAVTGGTVQLIYWPATPTITAPDSRTSNAAPVTAELLGTTFTSPTMYIQYGSVFAANACSRIGKPITNTIVAIPTNLPLSSLYATPLPCNAHFDNAFTQEAIMTASFNVTDLNEPVPYSIYSSQPFCATYSFEHNCGAVTCPTDMPYSPLLVVPEQVLQKLQPDWADCYGDIRGVYDPPLALQPGSYVRGPTMPRMTASAPMTIPVSTASPTMPHGSFPFVVASETLPADTQSSAQMIPPSQNGGTYDLPAGTNRNGFPSESKSGAPSSRDKPGNSSPGPTSGNPSPTGSEDPSLQTNSVDPQGTTSGGSRVSTGIFTNNNRRVGMKTSFSRLWPCGLVLLLMIC